MIGLRVLVFFIVGASAAGLASCVAKESSSKAAPAPVVVSIPAARLDMGRAAYQTAMCFKCHGEDGKGTTKAPNLTDGHWDHCDGTVEGILGVLNRGVPKSEFVDHSHPFGMQPATRRIHSEDELLALAQYVWSLSHGPEAGGS